MSDPLTPEELRAAIVAADAEVEALTQRAVELRRKSAALDAEMKLMEREFNAITGGWNPMVGTLRAATQRAERLRYELKASALPTVTVLSPHAGTPTLHRVESIGPKRMRTNQCDFTRRPDGSWTSYAGTVAPFDEAAVKAAIKAAKEDGDV